jgi:hypothetical protein
MGLFVRRGGVPLKPLRIKLENGVVIGLILDGVQLQENNYDKRDRLVGNCIESVVAKPRLLCVR